MKQDIKTFFGMIYKIYYVLDKKQRKACLGIFIVILVGSVIETLGVSAILPFIDALLAPSAFMENRYVRPLVRLFHITRPTSVILICGVGIIILYLFKNIYLVISSYFQIRFRTNLLKSLSVRILKSYIKRPYTFFLNINMSYVLRGVGGDVLCVCDILNNLFKLAVEGFTVILIGLWIFIMDPIMAGGILLLALLCVTVIVGGLKKKISDYGNRDRIASMEQSKYAYQIVNGIKEIKVMQCSDDFISIYESACDEKRKTEFGNSFLGACPERIIETICIGGLIAIVCMRVQAGIDPAVFVPQLGMIAVAAFRILPSMSRVTGYMNALIFFRPNLELVYDTIVSAQQYGGYLENKNLEAGESVCKQSFEDKLEVKEISWAYENAKGKVLDGLSLTIHKGESVAFIGASGAGKTTLADIILGLFEPQAGSVEVDGIDVYRIPKSWSKIVGYVPQSVYLTDDTIRNNVSFGIRPEEIEDEKVWAALEQAQLKKFVEGLPDGLDTMVGERGVKFSGGQRQRVAIARALYYNPDILVLDEATSALDTDTESAVMESIDALHGHKTLIIVAHRLTTIRNCDKVYEIRDGRAFLKDKKE